MVCGPVADGGEGVVQFGTLNGQDGFAIHEVNTSDRAGLSVSRAGDVNGHGLDDMIIGAYYARPKGGVIAASETYSVLGRYQPDPDCSENDVLDECDITGGLSEDLDADGAPDACAGHNEPASRKPRPSR